MGWLSVYFFVLCLAHVLVPLGATQSIQLQPDTVGTYTAGIVQVFYNGQWGTVCHDYWGMEDAKVACRQLGFTKSLGSWYYGQGTGNVWLNNMGCSGSESLLQSCSHDGWENVDSSCNGHTYDAGVVCAGRTGPGASDIRLIPDTRLPSNTGLQGIGGIVRVFHNNEWGTVCHDYWGMEEAKVACRQIGFAKTVGYWRYGRGTGKVWLNGMGCSGSEILLQSCTHYGWGNIISSCNGHTYDVGVVCSGYNKVNVRLQGGINATEGLIEIQHTYNGTWGTICDNGFGIEEANVVCRIG